MTVRCSTLVIALLVTALALGDRAPASGQSTVRTEVDTTLVTVGDRITLTVSVEHRPGARVTWPDSLALGPFEAVGAQLMPTRFADEIEVSSLVISLAAFELGELEIPPFEVAVTGPQGGVEVLETDGYAIEVVSVGMDDSGDIREIRGPLAVPISALGVVAGVLGVLLMAVAALTLYRRFRARHGDEEPGPRARPPRPAHELALEALAALEDSPLLGRGQVKAYHIAVSEILRTYIERRFRVDALEMTTVEVLAGLEAAGVDGGFREGLRRFLEQCDMVKFAKVRPTTDASREVLALGRTLVERSTPEVAVPDVDVEAHVGGSESSSDRESAAPDGDAAHTEAAPTAASTEAR